jgi:hypothetical protein
VGRQCTTNGRNVNTKEATGEEVEGRIPDRPRSKWLEKVSKDLRASHVSGQPLDSDEWMRLLMEGSGSAKGDCVMRLQATTSV